MGWGSLRIRLVCSVSDVVIAPSSVALLCLHSLVNEPKGVNVPRKIAKKSETNVDKQVTTAACDEGCRSWRKDNSNQDEDNV